MSSARGSVMDVKAERKAKQDAYLQELQRQKMLRQGGNNAANVSDNATNGTSNNPAAIPNNPAAIPSRSAANQAQAQNQPREAEHVPLQRSQPASVQTMPTNTSHSQPQRQQQPSQQPHQSSIPQQSQSHAPQDQGARHNIYHQAPAPQQSNTYESGYAGLGGIGAGMDDKAQKRAKQEEYARQLEQQQMQYRQQQPANDYGSGGLGSIGGSVDDRAQKRAKQEQYARQLEQQQQHHHNRPNANGFGGLGSIGSEDDKALKRAKQEEYARQLEQQQQIHRQQQQNNTYESGYAGLGDIGAGMDDKTQKRAKQEEYARQLEQQQMQYRQQQPANDYGSGGLGSIGGSVDDKAQKRAKQEQYARQLEQQQMQQQHQHRNAFDGYGGIGGIGATDDKALKRAKQEEYARQLEQQQYLQQHQATGSKWRDKGQHQSSAGSAEGGGIPEGYVMGPLGVPVRKTLEVGNRGVQKFYNQQTSPTKPSPMRGQISDARFSQQPPLFGPPMQFDQYTTKQEAPTIQPVAVGGVAWEGGDPDAIAKQKKLEHARALEMQIKENQMRLEQKKKEEEEREMLEQQRLEKERIAMQQAFEREQQNQKAKAEEERKEFLANQIEEKKRQKEAEEKAQKEYEAKEAARLERERLALQRQQEEEMARERGIPTGPPAVTTRPPSSHRIVEERPLSAASRRKEMFRADSVAIPPDAEALRTKEVAERQSRKNKLFDPPVEDIEDERPIRPQREIPMQEIDTPVQRTSIPATPVQRNLTQHRPTQNRDNDANNGVSAAEVERLKRETALAQESAEALRRELAELRMEFRENKKKEVISTPTSTVVPQLPMPAPAVPKSTLMTTPTPSARNPPPSSRPPAKPTQPKQRAAPQQQENDTVASTMTFTLDKTLKGESRFVYPDGKSYVLKPSAAPFISALQTTTRTTAPLPAPPSMSMRNAAMDSTLGNASSMRIFATQDQLHATETRPVVDKKVLSLLRPRSESARRQRSGSKPSISGAATPRTHRSDVTDDTPDIEGLLRKNRRRFEYLLSNESSTLGPDELELLVGGLRDISSRPSTASSSTDKRVPIPAPKSSSKHQIRQSGQRSLAVVAPEPLISHSRNHRSGHSSFDEDVDIRSSSGWEDHLTENNHIDSVQRSARTEKRVNDELLIDFSKYGF